MKIDANELRKFLTEFLERLDAAADGPEPDFQKLERGVYRIFWKNGDLPSVASVGRNRKGEVWFAPADWMVVPFHGWAIVERVELIEKSPR